jgi:CRP-like cAMP-binding protein
MTVPTDPKPDLPPFLAHSGVGRESVSLRAKEFFFSQGDVADSVFYLKTGRAKLTVISQRGKEGTITLLGPNDFIGEESISAISGLRLSTATATTACTALKIERDEMICALHEQHDFSDLFLKYLLARGDANSG